MDQVLDNYLDDSVINVFCDASVRKYGKGYCACAGAVAVCQNNVLSEDFRIVTGGTNIKGEIDAVKQGIFLGTYVKGKTNKTINLFSDSQLAIYGIRDRIMGWKCKDDKLYGYAEHPIAYFESFVEMINFMVYKDIKVNFYHQKGHVKLKNKDSMLYAIKTFAASNYIREQIPYDFVKYISLWNDYVDRKSRSELYKFDIYRNKIIQPVKFVPNNEYFNTLQQYENLQGGTINGKFTAQGHGTGTAYESY